jgi:hypothetical protein
MLVVNMDDKLKAVYDSFLLASCVHVRRSATTAIRSRFCWLPNTQMTRLAIDGRT